MAVIAESPCGEGEGQARSFPEDRVLGVSEFLLGRFLGHPCGIDAFLQWKGWP